MKKKILIRGPVLTQSGYGEHCRFLLRALKKYEDIYDLYVIAVGWGRTNWQFELTEERKWHDDLIKKTHEYVQTGKASFDISVQVTIPNEWEKLAPINIGVTAGIETDRISRRWIEKSQIMNKIIVVSEHAKAGFVNTKYDVVDAQTNRPVKDWGCNVPIDVVHYPVKSLDKTELDLDLDHDFNFLAVAQWGPRKNLKNTIKWFMDEFKNDKVGLVVKTNLAKNCVFDRIAMTNKIKTTVAKFPDAKCSVHLLHGYMTEKEMNGLYTHPKIKALVSITHGEGFGLPLFEAAYNSLPIIATNWSGHLDFLHMPVKNKKGKVKDKPMFSRIAYDLKEIGKASRWDGVLDKDAKWAYAEKGSYKMKLRDAYKDITRLKSSAKKLQKHILENFNEEKQYLDFATKILGEEIAKAESAKYVFVSDFFADQLTGGAELSLQTLINKAKDESIQVNSANLSVDFVERNKDKTWVFGNFTQVPKDSINKIVEEKVNYNIIEFDYKFCKYRNLQLHETLEGESCDCIETEHGQEVEKFVSAASNVFFMSTTQMKVFLDKLKTLKKSKCVVLSSIFDDKFFDTIKQLRELYSNKEDTWIVSSSPSWIKGTKEAEKWCVDNNKDYNKMHGLEYKEALITLAKSKGLCFLPTGADTCPRLVIEAKLLNCELELNENVQHVTEEWFNTENLQVTEDYLKGRPEVFWKKVSGV
jgi:glycosyltransferase involved in cell wall biosynthesis